MAPGNISGYFLPSPAHGILLILHFNPGGGSVKSPGDFDIVLRLRDIILARHSLLLVLLNDSIKELLLIPCLTNEETGTLRGSVFCSR